MKPSKSIKVCFVCLGNICRSPLAEGVFKSLVDQEGFTGLIEIDSAGTSAWHSGEPADERMRQTARKHGVQLSSRARKFIAPDFKEFDLVLAMDDSIFSRLQNLKPNDKDQLKLFRFFDPNADSDLNVPDPYYGGNRGFEDVYQIVERTCPPLLDYIKSKFSLASCK